MSRRRGTWLLLVWSLSWLCAPASAARPAPVGVAHVVERDGLKLALWEKRPGAAAAGYQPETGRIVLLLHGATWSGRPDFDLQVRDYSLMDSLARAGYDAFALDIHGYGASEPGPREDDYATADEAVKDIAAAVEFILRLRGAAALNLFGWSWGAHLAGLYAAGHQERIARLMLYGFFPGTSRRNGSERPPPERFRFNTYAATQSDFIDGEYDRDVAARFGREALAACPRSPVGVGIDFSYRMPLFTPQQIRVPILQIYGVYDLQPPQKRQRLPAEEFARIEGRCLEFFGQLATPDRRLVVIPGGGHGVHLERGHRFFQRAVLDYLNAGRSLGGRPVSSAAPIPTAPAATIPAAANPPSPAADAAPPPDLAASPAP